eukprot:3177489-Amphidinium_carterae.1
MNIVGHGDYMSYFPSVTGDEHSKEKEEYYALNGGEEEEDDEDYVEKPEDLCSNFEIAAERALKLGGTNHFCPPFGIWRSSVGGTMKKF